MNIELTNGASVSRIYSDGKGTELIGAFQYHRDAEQFAKFKVEEDKRRSFHCDYIVVCHYSGKIIVMKGDT